jgi:uncharacterized protein (DUF1800 family)
MPQQDLELVAHLMRRAGFGATRDDLEELASKDYEGLVEDLLYPERFPDLEEDVLHRYHIDINDQDGLRAQSRWIYRMINTQTPLKEKLTLFWHRVFATGAGKSMHYPSAVAQIETFRGNAFSSFREILMDLAKDPAMNFWLDNCENHKDEPNENWGRELLELFAMGVGNYSEQDVKMAARAFTGWTFTQPLPVYPFGNYDSTFVYREDDHDDSEKTFLGETGRLNGEDIIDIVVKQPATARYLSRHLYDFFVADEAQVPAWDETPPRDPDAIEELTKAYFDSGADVRSVLRVLFNSDFFKAARFNKVKSPIDFMVGTIKLAGTYRFPEPALRGLPGTAGIMGQTLMQPPTVEGWHTGKEWIDAGTMNARVNFAVNQLGNVSNPGVQSIVASLEAEGSSLAPEDFVRRCLDLTGPLNVGSDTHASLLESANAGGDLTFGPGEDRDNSVERIVSMVQQIVSSVDYQFE